MRVREQQLSQCVRTRTVAYGPSLAILLLTAIIVQFEWTQSCSECETESAQWATVEGDAGCNALPLGDHRSVWNDGAWDVFTRLYIICGVLLRASSRFSSFPINLLDLCVGRGSGVDSDVVS